jgi:hypothetical protein
MMDMAADSKKTIFSLTKKALQPWRHPGWSQEAQSHVALFVLHFIFCFVKASRWWGVKRSTQPHLHTYMFCPYVISTLYWLLEEYKQELSKDTFLL